MSVKLRGRIAGVLVGLMLVLPVLSACSQGLPTSPGNTTSPVWGLPFKTGTSVTLGCLGLHDDNIFADGAYSFTNQKPQGGTPPLACPPPHVDDPTHANEASLDLLTAAVGVPVIPLASGTVLVADESCHFVVVDHGSGNWVAYLHIDVQVTVGQQVTRNSMLGTTATPHGSACENSNAAHVHFAFLRGSGHTGTYVSMVGKVLCGYQVIKNAQYPIGALQEVAQPHQIVAPNTSLTIPNCAGATGPPVSGTPTPPAPVGKVTAFPLQTNSNLEGITTGPDGALWFTEYDANQIGRITTDGKITEFPIPTTNSGPWGITAGPDGALWFTENNINQIGRITTAGAFNEYRIPSVNGGLPSAITAGPDGALWFTDGDQIGRITTAGAITEFPPPAPKSGPAGITTGPDGALWFTEYDANQIGRITTDGKITEFRIPTAQSQVWDITAGSDGALWFNELRGDQIGRITTAGAITEFPLALGTFPGVIGITAGPDGALWFTEHAADRIGRITTSGIVNDFPLPPPGDLPPLKITAGPDGALWFTEDYYIGRITV